MAEVQHLDLPRPLVNQLLHAAQLHTTQVHWGIISSHAGNPEHCYVLNQGLPLEARAYHALCEKLTQDREQIWALYCSTTGEIVAPNSSELEWMKIPRFLGISLGIKGVLQLRGWRIESGHLQELEVNIRED
jgi:[CysO sulfur-carrier protein]-S-L-cysteine hydrolase